MSNKSVGKYVKNLDKDLTYYSYQPSSISRLHFDKNNYLDRLSIAYDNLAIIKSKIDNLNPHYMYILLLFESYYSEVLNGYTPKLDDVIIDVPFALNDAIYCALLGCDLLETTPISKRFIKKIHYQLDSAHKYAGAFRTTQNWIGDQDSNLKTARYIPPNPEDMQFLMDDLEKYINYNVDDPLIKMAMFYYQFYAIHPFITDNEIVARIMIQLILIENKLISQPILPISFFINTTHLKYYFMLNNVRELDTYDNWINYFLDILNYSIINLNQTLDQLLMLDIDFDCSNIFIKYPIITKKKFSQLSKLNRYQTDKLFDELLNKGIIKIHNNSKRYRSYVFDELFKIINESLL